MLRTDRAARKWTTRDLPSPRDRRVHSGAHDRGACHALPGSPPSYGFPLAGVYAIWLAVVAALYPACRWYGERHWR